MEERGTYMVCKFCQKEIEDDRLYCPHCGKRTDGKEVKPKAAPEKKNKTPLWQIIALIVLSAALIVSLVYLFAKEEPPADNTGTGTQSTTATTKPAEAPKEEPFSEFTDHTNDKVGTLLGTELSNGVLQMFYSSIISDFLNDYSNSLSYIGLDIYKPLDEQKYPYEGAETWEDFFLDLALERWQNCIALCKIAADNGYVLDAEWQKMIQEQMDSLEEIAKSNNYVSAAAMIKTFYGDCCTLEIYHEYLILDTTANAYYYTLLDVSDEQIREAFDKNKSKLAEKGITKNSALVSSVRHILIMPEGGVTSEDGKTVTYTDEEWDACKNKAQTILDEWKAGAATEESFAALATKYTQDTGSKANGGLYENVANDNTYVPEFQNWAVSTSRATGDVELVKTSFGYHIMYYVSGEPEWQYYSRTLAQEAVMADMEAKLDKLLEENPAEVNRDAATLQNVYAREK